MRENPRFSSYVTVVSDILRQKRELLSVEFQKLVDDGTLEITETEPVFLQDMDTGNVKLQQSVKLRFKGQERIDALEIENNALKSVIDGLKHILNEVSNGQ
jgi:hypothetical protein